MNKGNNDIAAKIIEKFDYDELLDSLRRTAAIAWRNEISITKILSWLENFTGEFLGVAEAERLLAMYVLLNYTYYNENEIKYLCKVIYEKYIHTKLVQYKEKNKYQDLSDPEKEEHIIKNTVFLSLGTPSESGGMILYWFREVNNLPKKLFEFNNSSVYENIVLIDDVTISGSQAIRYLKENQYKSEELFFVCFICTREARKNIAAEHQNINIISSILLEESSKAFSDGSMTFSGEYSEFKNIAKEMFEFYGKKATKDYPNVDDPYMEDYPLGFKNSQQLFGFRYNTPNNTLPLIWIDNNGWKSIFKREEKNYSDIEVNYDEKFL